MVKIVVKRDHHQNIASGWVLPGVRFYCWASLDAGDSLLNQFHCNHQVYQCFGSFRFSEICFMKFLVFVSLPKTDYLYRDEFLFDGTFCATFSSALIRNEAPDIFDAVVATRRKK